MSDSSQETNKNIVDDLLSYSPILANILKVLTPIEIYNVLNINKASLRLKEHIFQEPDIKKKIELTQKEKQRIKMIRKHIDKLLNSAKVFAEGQATLPEKISNLCQRKSFSSAFTAMVEIRETNPNLKYKYEDDYNIFVFFINEIETIRRLLRDQEGRKLIYKVKAESAYEAILYILVHCASILHSLNPIAAGPVDEKMRFTLNIMNYIKDKNDYKDSRVEELFQNPKYSQIVNILKETFSGNSNSKLIELKDAYKMFLSL